MATTRDKASDRRLCTLKTSFLIAAIYEELEGIGSGWISAKEVGRWFRESVGPINDRTVFRYSIALSEIGVLEEKPRRGARDERLFRFDGYELGGLGL